MKPYCPKNGCGMPNGAAPPVPVWCNNCNFGQFDPHQYPIKKPYTLTSFDKYCPKCKHCLDCGRLIKKVYLFITLDINDKK